MSAAEKTGDVIEPPERPKVLKVGDVLRDTVEGCFELVESSAWGRYLAPCQDPDGTDLDELRERFQVHRDIVRCPKELWGAVINLYIAAAEGKIIKGQSEVMVIFLRNQTDFDEWKVVVPTQEVGAVTCEANYTKPCRDILTGEEYPSCPPAGWIRAGTSHSHHTMSAEFSSTDDKNELPAPGLHVVVGDFKLGKEPTYRPTASIVQRNRRYSIKASNVIDLTPNGTPFHPSVKDLVEEERWAGFGSTKVTVHNPAGYWTDRWGDDYESLMRRHSNHTGFGSQRSNPYTKIDQGEHDWSGGSAGFPWQKLNELRRALLCLERAMAMDPSVMDEVQQILDHYDFVWVPETGDEDEISDELRQRLEAQLEDDDDEEELLSAIDPDVVQYEPYQRIHEQDDDWRPGATD